MTTKIVGLPAAIEQIVFGDLNGLPILYTTITSYALTTALRRREWIVVDQGVAGAATSLEEREFFMRFGSDLPPLPEPMRKFDHRLWSVDGDGLVFRRFLRKSQPSQDPTAEFSAPADRVVLFPKSKFKRTLDNRDKASRKAKKAKRKSADDEFYLGRHSYAFGPCSWVTEYRIRRQDDNGKFWEIFAVDEMDAHNDDDAKFTSMGSFTTDEAKEYFDGVQFDISDEKWRQMGCRNLHRPEEQDCAICGEPFEGDLSTVHRCKRGEFAEDA